MIRMSPEVKAVIARQVRLRRRLIPWRVIAELAGVSRRYVLKTAKAMREA